MPGALKYLIYLLLCLVSQLCASSDQLVHQVVILGNNSSPAMATLLLELSTGWHPGERAIHSLLNVPTSSRQNPTTAGLAPSYSYRIIASPLLAVGTVDDHGRPWTSLWGGERGFARPVAKDMLGVQSLVDKTHDPVVQALLGRAADGEVLQPDEGRAMSALSIDLESQDRVKLAGKMVVGTVAAKGHGNVGEAQIAMLVQESLGNCPKYLNKKSIRAHLPFPQLASTSLPLGAEALALVEKADLCFLSSSNGQTMDTNHRGGPPGFVRVLSNSPSHHREGGDGDGDGVVLVYPEYSGNRLYQTLGNLHINPRVGIAIPDLDTSDVLYLTGETQLLVGPSAAAVMPHTSLAVKITVHSARLVKDGLPFRGTAGEPSPYNPPVRRLASEAPSPSFSPAFFSSSPVATATLIRRDLLTPTIARLTFRLRPNPSPSPHHSQQETLQQPLLAWQPGQHVTLSLAHELASGWRHMDDADPQSLNDDYVRTFTITSPPPPPPPPPPRGGAATAKERETEMEEKMQPEIQMELTLRRHGHVTGLLFSHPLDGGRHARLEMPVLGFGGRFRIGVDDEDGGCGVGSSSSSSLSSKDKNEKNGKKKKKKKKAVFVAGGIGITPLLAQAQVPGVLAPASPCGSGQQRQEKEENEQDEIAVLWSLRGEDLPLAVEVLGRIEGLGRATRVFFTGPVHGRGKGAEMVQQVRALGARVDVRRMERADVLGAGDAERGTGYFVCASPGLLRTVLDWVGDEEAVFESFGY